MSKRVLAVLGILSALLPGCTKPAAEEEDVPISFVFLLRQPRPLKLPEMRAAAERAFGRKFSLNPDAEDQIRPRDPPGSFVIETKQFTLQVPNVAEPYGQPQLAKSGTLLDKAFREHRAWLSVDWDADGAAASPEEAFRTVGKLAAELAGDDCLALFCPRTGQMITYGPDLLPALRGQRPLSAFLAERK